MTTLSGENEFSSFYSDESEYCIESKQLPSLHDDEFYTRFEITKWFHITSIKKTNFSNFSEEIPYHVVSVSFFRAHVDNQGPGYVDTTMSFDNWERKYWLGLLRLIQQIHRINSESSNVIPWVLRIYISKQLSDEGYTKKILHELSGSKKAVVELYTMHSSSIGAQPGMLWRFLAFSDQTIHLCVVLDIDDDGLSEFKVRAIVNFTNSKHSLFGRYVGRGGVDGFFHVCRESTAKNYPAVLGSFVLFKPMQAAMSDINLVMEKFIYRMIIRSQELYPFERGVNGYLSQIKKILSPYDQVVHAHLYGWGGHWTMYGFDERFLKHVLLHYFAKTGAVLSFVQIDATSLHEVTIDCKYLQRKHLMNVFVLV